MNKNSVNLTNLTPRFQKWLWADLSTEIAPLKHAHHGVRVVVLVIQDFVSGRLPAWATSLAFTTLLSIVPLLAVSFSVLKAFGVHNQLEPLLINFLAPLGTQGEVWAPKVISYVENIKVGLLGSVGMAMLFYTVVSLLYKVESAFNNIWLVDRGRTIARRFSDYLSVALIGPVLLFAAGGMAASAMSHTLVQKMISIQPFGLMIYSVGLLLPKTLVFLAFTFIYSFLPNTKVKLVPAMLGALVATILWNGSAELFTLFVSSSAKYATLYSGFAVVILFMIWLNLAWFILLAGAQVSFYCQFPKLTLPADYILPLSSKEQEALALEIMRLLAIQHNAGSPPLTEEDLAAKLPIVRGHLHERLHCLSNSGLVNRTEGEEPGYLPSQDIHQLTVSTILSRIRDYPRGVGAGIHEVNSLISHSTQAFFNTQESAQNGAIGQLTLAELMTQSSLDTREDTENVSSPTLKLS